jgi:membrane-associated phospholipid phosphatase
MMHKVLQLDKGLFKLINYTWHNNFFDFLMPWLRDAELWAPLYFFLILLIAVNYKKTGLWWVAFFLSTVVISNYVSSNIIKEHIARVRPCSNPEFASWIRILVGYIPMNSSFVSSHAANHFALAIFFYLTLKEQFGKWPLLFFLWAFFISYAQIYVGVHYPTDVLGGTFVGLLIGYFTAKLFNKYFGLSQPSIETSAILN